MDNQSNNLMEEVLDLCLADEKEQERMNEWLDHCVQMVQSFVADGVTQFDPVLFAPVPTPEGDKFIICVMPLPGLPSDPAKKQAVFYAAGVACVEATKLPPLAVFGALEIFKAPPMPEEEVTENRVRPSQHPDRTEHIIVLGSTPAGVVNLAELDITGRNEHGHLQLAAPRPAYAPVPGEFSAPMLAPFWIGVEAGWQRMATAQGKPIA
jgi:hypothetical protein